MERGTSGSIVWQRSYMPRVRDPGEARREPKGPLALRTGRFGRRRSSCAHVNLRPARSRGARVVIPRRRYDWPAALARLVASHRRRGSLVAGPAVSSFEREVARYLDDRVPPLTRASGSGRRALAWLLAAHELPLGATVLLPGYTLGALVPYLQGLGYRVRTCDVAARRPVMTAETVAAAWKRDVRVVLVTHLFGHVADTAAIAAWARARGALVLEDCAHALGARLTGRPVGLAGDGALLSFDALKSVNTVGGGMAVLPAGAGARVFTRLARDPAPSAGEVLRCVATGLAEDTLFAGPWLRLPSGLLAFSATRRLVAAADSRLRRAPSRPPRALSNLQAAIGLDQLADLEERLRRRRGVARRVLAALDLHDDQLAEGAPRRATAYFVVVRAASGEDSHRLRRELWLRGVDAGVGTEVADDLSPLTGTAHPNARDWYRRALQLPCYTHMAEATETRLARILRGFRGRLC